MPMMLKQSNFVSYFLNKRFVHGDGDHLTLLNVYHAFKQKGENQEWCRTNFLNFRSIKAADDIREQLKQIMVKLGLKLCSTEITSQSYSSNIRKCLIEGFFTHVNYSNFFDEKRFVIYKDRETISL
jgi:pre-mRNA-splicing factor ATP-dependent RNA helicase DHX15/PRP43